MTQKFPGMLSSIPSLQDDEDDVSYDVDSLFTKYSYGRNNQIYHLKIYVHKKLTPICSKLISGRLLIKLSTEFTFKFNSRFLR